MPRLDCRSGVRDGTGPVRILRRLAGAATLIVMSLIVAAPTEAQVRAGVHGLYQNELLDGTWGYGGRVEFDLGFLFDQLVVGGTYDKLSPECSECAYWKAGGQVGFLGGMGYVGLGTYYSEFDQPDAADGVVTTTEWTFELGVSVRLPLKGFFTPFFEIRNQLGEGVLNSQTLALGFLVGPYLARGSRRTSGHRTR